MTQLPLPDLGTDPEILNACGHLATLARARLSDQGADLGCMALVWIVTDAEGNSASCLLSHDPGPEALEHMAECLLGQGDEWEQIPVNLPGRA
jgi:hypothetical protein